MPVFGLPAPQKAGCSLFAPKLELDIDPLQFQLCVAYSTTGFYKLMGAAWVNGTALEQVLANANYSKLATTGEFILPLWSIPFLRISTWQVLFWELLFPLLIWKRRIRYLALFFGVLVHLESG